MLDSRGLLVQLVSQAAMEMMETRENRVAVDSQAHLDLLGTYNKVEVEE